MRKKYVLSVALVLAVFWIIPVDAFGDIWDNFSDGEFSRFPSQYTPPWWFGGDDPNYDPRNNPNYDPNWWDPNNPDWRINNVTGADFVADANSGLLRLYVQGVPTMPFGYIGAECDDGNSTAGVSTTYFDCSDSHYVRALMYNNLPLEGMGGMMFHFDLNTWNTMSFEYEPYDGAMGVFAYPGGVDKDGPQQHYFWCVVEAEYIGDANYYDPNRPTDANYVVDPNYYNDNYHPDHPDPNGLVLLAQVDVNGVNQHPGGIMDANDPNCHWFRCTFWDEEGQFNGKFRWNVCIVDPEFNGKYYPAGTPAFSSYGGGDTGTMNPGGLLLSDFGFGEVEAKWGCYKQELWQTCALTIKMKDCLSLSVSPDLLDDPNDDPNDLGKLRRYPPDSPIMLHAVVPVGNKVFKKWTIKGPNDASDPAYQIVNDTNQVLYLTMDGDYLVKATCKCGGGGIEPFAVAVLVLLGLGLIIRRLR